MTDYSSFKQSVLRFLDQCGVGDGIADEAAWEAADCPPVTSTSAAQFVKTPAPRVKPLSGRLADNDWAFASTPGGGESLEGGHSAVEALYLLGELDRLSPANRRAWVESFNRHQDEATGYYLGPYIPQRDHASWRNPAHCSHPWDHMHDHLVSCLCPTLMLLGGQSRFPLSRGSQTGRFLDRAYLEHYLTGRDWNDYRGDGNYRRHNPWWMGNEFWYPACMLWQISVWEAGTPAAATARRLLDEVWYPWHDRNFACNGLWAGDLDGDPARLWHGSLPAGRLPEKLETPDELRWSAMMIMGGAHQLWFYDFDNHPIPDAVRRAQTDAVLALQNRHNGHFGMGDVDNPAGWSNNCTDVDCLTVLAMNHHRQDYRRAEIAAAAERAASAILTDRINAAGVLQSVPGAPFTHCFNSWPTYSPAGSGNVLDQSFYLWAVAAACTVIESPRDAALHSFVQKPWPRVPSHWLWIPEVSRVESPTQQAAP